MKLLQKNDVLEEKTTQVVVDELQPILTDLIALGLIVKQAHWNVTGANFRPVHQHLDEIWAAIQTNVDDVAERITALGAAPSGQGKEVSAETKLSQIPLGFLNYAEVVDLMTDRIGNACRNIRGHMEKIEDPDPVTADILHAVVEGLEKHLWMLRVQGM